MCGNSVFEGGEIEHEPRGLAIGPIDEGSRLEIRRPHAVYERLDGTTKRTELRDILAGPPDGHGRRTRAEILFLSQGQLRPEYEGVELGLADSLAPQGRRRGDGLRAKRGLSVARRARATSG